jgi:hypothetical protein
MPEKNAEWKLNYIKIGICWKDIRFVCGRVKYIYGRYNGKN